ncbi:hypothetical protein [Sphaerisporangium siamense]|uniref:Uncharacterized protein n=1 Tax=Sphaerisporangium siamense TaxID=795645 RepID=A0A7W7GDI7_9ACTN|nr:hypothetical protein [Sphaerisporangium siamense]MBB4704589.1 hypothetical protein [Sphaerisporangium siamense]
MLRGLACGTVEDHQPIIHGGPVRKQDVPVSRLQPDPLTPANRRKAAENAKKAYYQRATLKMRQAKAAKRASRGGK